MKSYKLWYFNPDAPETYWVFVRSCWAMDIVEAEKKMEDYICNFGSEYIITRST